MATTGGYVFTMVPTNCDNESGGVTPTGGSFSTGPHGGGGFQSVPSDPCQTLSDAKAETKVQQAIDDLKTKTTGKQEFAYEIERRRSLMTDSGFSYKTVLKTGINHSVIVQTADYVQGQAHNHPVNGLAIPSWDDISWTQQCEEDNYSGNDNTAFNITVSQDPANPGSNILYGITIDNLAMLQQATNLMFNLPKILVEPDVKIKKLKIMEIEERKFIGLLNNTNAQEKTFLKTYANYGITLSKFNDATQKWEKLKLDPANQNNVIKEPCN